MKHKFFAPLLAGFSLFAILLTYIPETFAIGVRPVRNEISLPPGQSTEGELTVINDTDKDFLAEPTVQVFYETDENGALIYPTEETEQAKQLRNWLELPTEPVNVPAKGSTNVKYKLNIPADAEPGGKYISIAYQPIKEVGQGVTVNVRVASLLLINVEGDVVRSGNVTDFSLPKEVYTDQPISFNVKFENTGTTHIKPTGTIAIVDTKTQQPLTQIAQYTNPESGKEVIADKIPVNLVGGNVLPKSPRKLEASWNKNIREGDYKALLSLEFPGLETPITQEFSFSIKSQLSADNMKMQSNENGAVFSFNLKNEGSFYEVINGTLSIENAFGYKVYDLPLPKAENSKYLNPGESKAFELPWTIEGGLPKGKYTAKLNVNYGFEGQNTLTQSLKFGEADRMVLYLSIALGVVVLGIFLSVLQRRTKKRRETI